MFFWNSLAFSMTQQMLAIWSLVPLPLLNPAWTSGSSRRSDRLSAWRTMDGSSWHCTGGRDQDHPQEKEMQKGKMAVWGGLTNTWEKKRSKRQRRKGKIYPFGCRVPKITRRDEKAFLSDQCKDTEENNRMGKTGDLFKKITDTKGTFHARWHNQGH